MYSEKYFRISSYSQLHYFTRNVAISFDGIIRQAGSNSALFLAYLHPRWHLFIVKYQGFDWWLTHLATVVGWLSMLKWTLTHYIYIYIYICPVLLSLKSTSYILQLLVEGYDSEEDIIIAIHIKKPVDISMNKSKHFAYIPSNFVSKISYIIITQIFFAGYHFWI